MMLPILFVSGLALLICHCLGTARSTRRGQAREVELATAASEPTALAEVVIDGDDGDGSGGSPLAAATEVRVAKAA